MRLTYGAAAPADELWWRHGVVYQVYPRSFLDGCIPACTGTGSLHGITSKLSHLRTSLGVNIIWISPIYDSPMADFGYDIRNYTSVWPTFGTDEDVRNLVSAARQIGMHVLLDLVPNHSSDEHPWFVESKSSKSAAKRDWYIWRDPSADAGGGPPTNWRSMFCFDVNCSAWQFDATTGQYYYHQFLKEQPDLNWRNPEVVAAFYDVMRFWLRMGVSGFRVDAFINLLEDPTLSDEPLDPDWHGDPITSGYEKLLHTRTENQPGMHEVLLGMQAVLREFGPDKMMIGEVYADKIVSEADVISYYGTEASPEFNMPFNFELVPFFGGSFSSVNGSSDFRNATALRSLVDHYEKLLPAFAQPNYVLGNHDNRRVRTRVGGSERLARSLMLLLLTLRGTPTIYNGDEIGMTDIRFIPREQRQDPTCKVQWESGRCRDPERTPLQWTSGPNAGFTGPEIVPWLPIAESYTETNIAQQLADPSSFFALTAKLLSLRAASVSLHAGALSTIACSERVFCFVREAASEPRFLIAINLGKEPATVDPGSSLQLQEGTIAIASDAAEGGGAVHLSALQLKPEQGLVVQLPALMAATSIP